MIVIRKLSDLPADRLAPHALAPQRLDPFIAGLFATDPRGVLAAVRGHRAALRHPPRSASDHLAALEVLGLSATVSLLRPHETAI